jgi:hypothetical protein
MGPGSGSYCDVVDDDDGLTGATGFFVGAAVDLAGVLVRINSKNWSSSTTQKEVLLCSRIEKTPSKLTQCFGFELLDELKLFWTYKEGLARGYRRFIWNSNLLVAQERRNQPFSKWFVL